MDPYLEIKIDGQRVDVDIDETPLALNWQLESLSDFTRKKGSEAFDITTQLNNRNSEATNTLADGNVVDMTANGDLERPRQAQIIVHGYELLNGKALLKSASHAGEPLRATWNFYGNNADWVIDLKEVTLKDIVNPRPIVFNHAVVEASWSFDGQNEATDYVFALARYGRPFGFNTENNPDEVVTIYDLRPSLSIYFLLERAFRLAGYRIESQFLNTPTYRRKVMPWVFGNFMRLDNSVYDSYRFKANTPESERETGDCMRSGSTFNRYVNLKVSNDNTDGMFDNTDTYTWDNTQARMVFVYPASAPSTIIANLSVTIFLLWKVTHNSDLAIWADWYVNGTRRRYVQLRSIEAPGIGTRTFTGDVTDYFEPELTPGDTVDLRIFFRTFSSGAGNAECQQYVTEFGINYFNLSLNSTIQLSQFNKLSQYKFLDLLNGEKQLYDLQFETDTQRKVVTIEPMFPHGDIDDPTPGFLTGKKENWTYLQDMSKESTILLKSDYEREWLFCFKEDNQDGAIKKMQDRFNAKIGQAKYMLPERYKQGKKEVKNDFYAPLMHVQAQQFGSITGLVPQIPCIYPENISNTSSTESENTIEPKIAYYKGNISGVGGWRWLNDQNVIETKTTLPFMFAVNYHPGGEDDPVLSYADQAIDDGAGGVVIAYGLFRRHFLPRMAMYRHGRLYYTFFRFKPSHMIGKPFRNLIQIGQSLWVLIEINGYEPLKDESTASTLWRWHPITQQDIDNSFPSSSAVLEDNQAGSADLKYVRHLILFSDLPK